MSCTCKAGILLIYPLHSTAVPDDIEHPVSFCDKLLPSLLHHVIESHRGADDCLRRIRTAHDGIEVLDCLVVVTGLHRRLGCDEIGL